MNLFKSSLLTTAMLAAAPLAMAASPATDTMTVSIKIENTCTIVADDMSFGTRADVDTAINTSSQVRVNCTGKGPIRVDLTAGNGGASTFATRQMNFGANTINFNLYTQTAGGGSIIGDGSASTVPLFNGTSIGASGTDTFTVHGYVPGSQGPKPGGDYVSTITASVAY
jgi:spore coat protein U-like protein